MQEAAAALEAVQEAAAPEAAQDAAQAARGPGTGPASPAAVQPPPPHPALLPLLRSLRRPARLRAGTTPAAGWCKIIGDWAWDEPPVPLAVLREVTSAVHAIGGKVSVHAQTAAGCANAVAAGVDSLEHGMHLDPGLLDQMAAQGTALVPTLSAFAASAFRVRAGDPGPRRDSFLAGWAAMPPTARAAYEAGVTVLAGTDTHPSGTVAEEAERLMSAGLPGKPRWARLAGPPGTGSACPA